MIHVNTYQAKRKNEEEYDAETYADLISKPKNDWEYDYEYDYYDDEPTRDERRLAAISHLSAWLSSFGAFLIPFSALIPLAIYFTQRNSSPFVARHALQAFVFQVVMTLGVLIALIAGSVVYAIGIIVAGISVLLLVGLVALPVWVIGGGLMLAALALMPFLMPFIATIAGIYALRGRRFNYPLINRYVLRRMKK